MNHWENDIKKYVKYNIKIGFHPQSMHLPPELTTKTAKVKAITNFIEKNFLYICLL